MADHHPSGKESLRAVVISCFSAILSGNQHQMKDAEEGLKALQVTEGEGITMKPSLYNLSCTVIHVHTSL